MSTLRITGATLILALLTGPALGAGAVASTTGATGSTGSINAGAGTSMGNSTGLGVNGSAAGTANNPGGAMGNSNGLNTPGATTSNTGTEGSINNSNGGHNTGVGVNGSGSGTLTTPNTMANPNSLPTDPNAALGANEPLQPEDATPTIPPSFGTGTKSTPH